MKTRALVGGVLMCAVTLSSACKEGARAAPDGRDHPHISAALEEIPPSIEDAAGATYWGGLGRRLTLEDGEWKKTDGPARVHLLRDFYKTGDLNKDGVGNAVVVLEATDAGAESGHYLAVLRHDGLETISMASVLIGHPVKIRDLQVEGDRILIDLTRRSASDPECCPSEQVRVTYALQRGGLAKVAETVDVPGQKGTS